MVIPKQKDMNTSYFANLKNIKTPLSISNSPPKWYSNSQFKVLAPPWSLVKAYKLKEVDDEGYIEQFKILVLAPLDASKVYEDLTNRYGNDVTLLCYEKPGDFCHRRIVAEWFEKELNIVVPELPNVAFYKSLNKET